jgi:UDP-2,3-diacylglucosamine pyrophosphatase LpxH
LDGAARAGWKDCRVPTAVISDLHLGTRTRIDLLGRAEIRRTLMGELAGVDEVVLLGDSIELRDRPIAEALAAATPFFRDLGEALSGGRVTVVPGNHDYQLASAWLGRRRTGARLGLEQRSTPLAGDPLRRLASEMGGTKLELAYPGLWLRPDLYATHGHYLDCHNRVATFECLASAFIRRLVRPRRDGLRTPDDYEAVLAPLYHLIFRSAQSRPAQRAAYAAKRLVRAWERRLGYRGPVRRPGLEAMAQVIECLGIRADYVVFGHLHGPVPTGTRHGWETVNGTQLVNTGSWVHEPAYLGPSFEQSSYWPGTCTFVSSQGPPVLRHLLRGLTLSELGG